jgi:hypothetical protein
MQNMTDGDQRLVTIADYLTPAEAGVLRSRLDAERIPAFVDGELIGTALSHLTAGVGGARLLVREGDVERALTIVERAADEAEADANVPDRKSPPWICPRCRADVEAGFEICWQCGTVRDGGDEADPEFAEMVDETRSPHDPELAADFCPMCGGELDGEGACRSCGEELQPPPPELSEGELVLQRAWRAALIGIVLCPPLLNVYSLLQLVEYQRLRNADDPIGWRFWATGLLDCAVIAFFPFVIITQHPMPV